MRPIILGIFAALFFAFTFVLNQSMEIGGGSWVWSASLRYFFMVPLLVLIVACRKNLAEVWQELKANPVSWLIWSTVGFGLFYGGICFAGAYGPGWLVAGTWQLTIISGTLLAPLFYEKKISGNGSMQLTRRKIPFRSLTFSIFIVLGVIIMQLEFAVSIALKDALFCLIPILIASFAYPLGNRKMMEICDGRLDVFQRVLGMTIASLPFWILLSIGGVLTGGLPGKQQVIQSAIVAVFSGIIATILFFAATDLVKDNMIKLGAVEATQSLEVLFALLGEVLFLSAHLPSPVSFLGISFVMFGMILHSVYSSKKIHINTSVEA
ncbi:multidrug resistance efflux transporter family protein [Niallia sp.]|uniref:DMT family transporter n=1 Tax=Niallia sp. TaxID=2837523 RepID=UPI002899637B|nr:multidrug resistance efflux transporter family protein [Niallia sp.]